MSDATPDQKAMSVAQNLTAALNGARDEVRALRDRLDVLEEHDRKTRRNFRLGVGGLGFDVVLTIAGFVLGGVVYSASISATHALDTAQHNSASVSQLHGVLVQGCQVNNDLKAKQKAALDGVLVTPPNATSAQRLYLELARAKIAAGWAPRNCQVAYGVKGTSGH